MEKDEVYYSSLKEYREQELLEKLIDAWIDDERARELVEYHWRKENGAVDYVDWIEGAFNLGWYDKETLDGYLIIWDTPDDFVYCEKEDGYAKEWNCTVVCGNEYAYDESLYVWSDPENEYIRRDDAIETHDGEWISQWNESFSRCPSCGDVFHEDDMRWSEREEDMYCDRCYEERQGSIHSYGYKPSLQFRWEGPLFMGCEIEVHELHDLVDEILDDEEHFRATEDSSLDDGAEFVSNPMTLEWIHEHLDLFQKLSERLKNAWWKCDTESGLHIHASRAWLEGDDHINRIWDMLHLQNNFPTFRKLAWRSPTHYCERDELTLEEIEKLNKEKTGKPWMWRRHSRLNLLPEKTIEFRMFISTLSWEYWIARFEMVHALIEYTRKPRALQVDLFLQRASEQWEKYSKLMWLAGQKDLFITEK